MPEFIDFYEPAEDSFLLQNQVKQYAYGKVLDVGTGSGIQSLAASTCKNVTSILAIDINPVALEHVQTQAKEKNLNIKTVLSSKFNNLPPSEKFDTIICNPPYLPEDAHIEDPALYGGKHGFEWSEDFIMNAANYLEPSGQILFLFSSLTIKEKIDTLIRQNLLESTLLSTGKIPFETLYVYKIIKTPLRNAIESKNVHSLVYHAKGKRGLVYKGIYSPSSSLSFSSSEPNNLHLNNSIQNSASFPVAIKITNPQSHAKSRIEIEGTILREMNKYQLGPKLYYATTEFLILEFIDGATLEKSFPSLSFLNATHILADVLIQCYIMDVLGYTKEEMHHPHKHILLPSNTLHSDSLPSNSLHSDSLPSNTLHSDSLPSNTFQPNYRPIFIDFERTTKTLRPKNVTQCLEYFARSDHILHILHQTSDQFRIYAKSYQKTYESFQSIFQAIFPALNIRSPTFTPIPIQSPTAKILP